MNQTLQDLLPTTSSELSVLSVSTAVLSAAVLGFVLMFFYRRFGRTMSDRVAFSQNFVIVSVTTTLVIAVVKSSLALSLGLVGALSIVRFRTAIKGPEELSYLFLSISVGLGFGAGQYAVTFVAFALILAVIIGVTSLSRGDSSGDHLIVIRSSEAFAIGVESLVEAVRPHCSRLTLTRLEEIDGRHELVLEAELTNLDQIVQIRNTLASMNAHLEVSFIQNTSIGSFT